MLNGTLNSKVNRKGNRKKLKNFLILTFIGISISIGLTSGILDGLMEMFSDDPNTMIRNLIIYMIVQILVYVLFISIYAKLINKKIVKPINNLKVGLNEISNGNYHNRIDMEMDYELAEIKNSFNQMAEIIEKNEIEKQNYQIERNLLFANITHDLKSPLTTVLGYSQALKDSIVKSDGKQVEYANSIYQNVIAVNRLIDLLFQYTKLDNDNYHFKYEKADIAEIIRSTFAMMYSDFEDKQMEIEIDMPETKVIRAIDVVEFSRAIRNLINNALKHNEKGTNVFVKLVKESDDKTIIIIADNGVEIPEIVRKRVFDPFFCGDQSRNSKGGSGLGLSITQKIIEKHGGNITIDSSIKGYTKAFRIEF